MNVLTNVSQGDISVNNIEKSGNCRRHFYQIDLHTCKSNIIQNPTPHTMLTRRG